MTTFSAKVDDWASKSEARVDAVRRESVQRLVAIAQTPVAKGGNMPVDTGFLRSSLMASTATMPRVGEGAQGSESQITLAIANWDAGQPLYLGYTANYAAHVHWGTRGRAARLWVTLAAQRWKQIVAEVARELRSRAS